ncbi:FUSC family protein [Advenella alkanexedens]|uniref:FUSC family protein n=1 Tax=Advenella alkanexedens TaxID=1481665 RepID=A0ABS6NKB0_9BURK|nr:FUSC family membrane protein [Advenella alkanexedens]MBV4396069.1 FUSC family protein [Advenella alkanexedens]
MDLRAENITKFLYSPSLFYAVRKAIGVLLPVIIFLGVFQKYNEGMAFAAGALCIALIDQPGGTKKSRFNEMLAGLIMGNLAALITGLINPYPPLVLIVICAQVFFFSMLSVYGVRGGFIGFSCMLIMMLTLSTPLTSEQALSHIQYTLLGSVSYFLFSIISSYIFRFREERQTLADALYATADYMKARADLYDTAKDLDDCYRQLTPKMVSMTNRHQTARDVVLRNLPEGKYRHDRQRIILWNIFIDMIALLDTLVATQTDYVRLRERFRDHDILLFMRDTLFKQSRTLNRTALSLSRNRPVDYRNSVKAELRAIEFEIEQLRNNGLQKEDPETYALAVQILRRMRNANRFINRIADNLRENTQIEPLNTLRRDHSLIQFQTSQEIRLDKLRRNLNMESAIFRYALRVTLAVFLVLLTINLAPLLYSDSATIRALTNHSYWIVITILIIMRPGFALTRQRTEKRLTGTILGCAITLLLFLLTDNAAILFIIMLLAMVLGNAFVATNYRLGSTYITIYVLIGFYFLTPSVLFIIGERALDTALACLIAFGCSFVFPWWEKQQILKLARKTIQANHDYLQNAMLYAQSSQQQGNREKDPSPADNIFFFSTQLARKNLHNAYSEFADSVSRMLNEPKSKQIHIRPLNKLLVQNDTVGSEINSLIPYLASLPETPPKMQQSLDYIEAMLDENRTEVPDPPSQIETDGEYSNLAFPLKQMQKAVENIRKQAVELGLMPAIEKSQNKEADSPVPTQEHGDKPGISLTTQEHGNEAVKQTL